MLTPTLQIDTFSSCLIHLGEQPPPEYYRYSLEQLRLFSKSRIFLVCENLTDSQKILLESLSIEHITPSSLPKIPSHEEFLEIHRLDKSFRDGFWTYVVERFYVLEEVMNFLGTEQILHSEGDNLVFHQIEDLASKLQPLYPGLAVPFDHDQRAVAGIFFVFSKTALSIFNRFSVEMYKTNPGTAINDMQLLGFFREAYPQFIDCLPAVPTTYPGSFENLRGQASKNPLLFSKNFDSLGMIFDANALGQYIDGIDPRNSNGKDTRGFINETAMHRFDYYKILYEFDESQNTQLPLLSLSNDRIKIANLHVHSKNLNKFSSRKKNTYELERLHLSIAEDIPIWDVITSERIQELADLCIADQYTYDFYSTVKSNPRIKTLVIDGPRSHLSPTKEQFRDIERARILFVNTHIIHTFQQHILPHLTEPFVLISHASDDAVDNKFIPLLEDCRLIHWYAQNVVTSHPKLTPIPIGIANTQFTHGNLASLDQAMRRSSQRNKLLFTCINEKTNASRHLVQEQLRQNGFGISKNTFDYPSYLNELSEYFFVSSPRGNGLDCHRTWESLYLGAIPLVDEGAWPAEFSDLGVVPVKDWSTVTEKFLIEKFQQLNGAKHDLRKLRLSFWSTLIRNSASSL